MSKGIVTAAELLVQLQAVLDREEFAAHPDATECDAEELDREEFLNMLQLERACEGVSDQQVSELAAAAAEFLQEECETDELLLARVQRTAKLWMPWIERNLTKLVEFRDQLAPLAFAEPEGSRDGARCVEIRGRDVEILKVRIDADDDRLLVRVVDEVSKLMEDRDRVLELKFQRTLDAGLRQQVEGRSRRDAELRAARERK